MQYAHPLICDLHPWPQHVWSGPRPMAGRLVEGMVGPNPPYHAPTFVLTHYEREPLVMEGGTTFYFVTGGIEEALRLAKKQRVTRTSRLEAVSPPCGSICRLG